MIQSLGFETIIIPKLYIQWTWIASISKYQTALKHGIWLVLGGGYNLGSCNDKQRFVDKNVVFIEHNKHQDTIANHETVFLSFCVSYFFIVHILVSVIFIFVDLLPFTTFIYLRFKIQNEQKYKILCSFRTNTLTLFCKGILVFNTQIVENLCRHQMFSYLIHCSFHFIILFLKLLW